MTELSQRERKHLEIAFESSNAIVKLAGLQESHVFSYLEKQILDGELTFDEAVQNVVMASAVALPVKK